MATVVSPAVPVVAPATPETFVSERRVNAYGQEWWTVAQDTRLCLGCDQPIDHGASRTAVFETGSDGEHIDVIGGRWWHSDCAVFAAKKANRDRVMYPRHSPCARCGGELQGDHVLVISNDLELAGAWCDSEMTLRYLHPNRPTAA